jgi:type II secretion system protein N
MEIAKVPVLASFGVNASGQIGGSVKLDLDHEDGTKATGRIDLAVKTPRIEESNLILVKIPTTVFDRGGAAVIDIKDGKVDLVDVGLHGDDLDLSVEGEILLKKRLSSSQWSAKSVIRASDAWRSSVPGFDAIVGAGKQKDGSYRYRIAGVLGGLPRTIPDRSR